jgi:hypothetical protein
MQLIHVKPAPATTRKKKSRKANLQDSFEKYWRLVEKGRQDNATLADDLAQLRRRYEADVLPAEQEFNEVTAQECYRLVAFLNGDGLSDSIRITLIDWLTGNVEDLERHPYYPAAERDKIVKAMVECLQQQLPQGRKGRRRRKAPGETTPGASSQQNLFGEGELGGLDQQQSQSDEDQAFREMEAMMKEILTEDEWQDFKQMFGEEGLGHGHADGQHNAALQRPGEDLVRPESINLLFRRLAKVLHPDKELDPDRKAEKHELMSQLLKAREHNDLPALLALHRQYVTDEPLVVEEEELRGLIAMLKSQLEQLAADQQLLISQDPVTFAVFHWYYGKAPKRINSSIKQHLQGLDSAIDESRYFLEHVKTAKQLRSFMRTRGMA